MKNKFLFGLLFLMLFILFTFRILYKAPPQSQTLPKITAEKMSVGTEDDPMARMNYEWLRLRNPQTNAIPRNIRTKELAFAKTLPTRESLTSKGGNRFSGANVLAWSARGPFNVGGRTRALAIDITNANIVLAGGVSGGMYRSTDGGLTWTNITGASQLHSITSIVQDTRLNKTNIWYYTTGELIGGSAGEGSAFFRGDGIFKSVDNGLTWTQLASTVSNSPQSFDQPFDFCWNIAIDPANTSQDEVYAATFGGVQRSTDGGSGWTTAKGSFSNSASKFTDVAVTSDGVVYATFSQRTLDGSNSADKGIWRSTDGVSWTNITPVGWPATYNRIVLAIAPSNENRLYFFAETPGSGVNGVSFWRYTFLGGDGSGSNGTWDNRSANLPALGAPVGDIDVQGSYDMVVKVKPDNPDVVFIGGTNLYRSTDGFATSTNWTWIGGYNPTNDISVYPNHHPDVHAHIFLPSNSNIVISGHDGGLSKTTNIMADSVIWSSLNAGYLTSQFYSLAIDHATSGNDIIIGGLQDNGNYFTNNVSASAPWLKIGSGDGAFSAIADSRNAYFTSVQNGKVFREIRNDNGVLSIFQRVDPAGGSGYLFINPFVLDPNNNNILYIAGGDRIWRNNDVSMIPPFSNDPATTGWSQLTNSMVGSGTISAFGISPAPANMLYYGTSNGQLFRLDGANAGNPSPVDIGSSKGLPAGAYVSGIAVNPFDGVNALLVFSNYSVPSLFYTQNAGDTWTNVSGNLEENTDGSGSGPSVRWAAILPRNSETDYFIATSAGLFSTNNLDGNATVWAQEGANSIGNVVVNMIATRPSDGLVVAATHGAGIYSAAVPGSEFLFPATNLTAQATNNDVLLQWTSPQPANLSNEVELLFDDGSFEGFLGFTNGTGEVVSGPFVPPSFPASLVSMSFLTGGQRTGDNVAINIYVDATGSVTNPSSLQLAGTISPVQIGVGGLFQVVDLSSLNITLNSGSTFFVSVQQLIANQNMAVGLDTGAPDGNAFFGANGSFQLITSAGFAGAFAIRTLVDVSGGNSAEKDFVGNAAHNENIELSPEPVQLSAVEHPKRVVTGFMAKSSVPRSDKVHSNTTATLQSFKVFRSTSPNASVTGTLIATVDASVTGLQDQNLADDTYYFQVIAVYDAGESIPSNEEQVVISVVSVKENEPQSPDEFSLVQNYPNPFNPTTVIRFSIPQSRINQPVRLEIFNALGQKVRTLVDGPKTSGVHSVEWDGKNDIGRKVASGLYMYRLRSGEFIQNRKMLLLK